MLRHILDFVYPRLCVMCGNRLTVNETCICTVCDWHLPRTGYVAEPYNNRMTRLFFGQFPIERAAAWFFYMSHSATSHLIYKAKYYGNRDLCFWLGATSAKEFLDENFFKDIDAIIPMPVTAKRKRERGYNQCYEIARGITSITHIPIIDGAVKRINFVKSQTQLNDFERHLNVQNAFRLVNPELLKGKHILLLDDVVTTGSTISSCGREIAKAGNMRISVMAIGVAAQ